MNRYSYIKKFFNTLEFVCESMKGLKWSREEVTREWKWMRIRKLMKALKRIG